MKLEHLHFLTNLSTSLYQNTFRSIENKTSKKDSRSFVQYNGDKIRFLSYKCTS